MPIVKTLKRDCGGNTHQIGLDENGQLHLLDHDIEEEETLKLMGLETSCCYNTYYHLVDNPDAVLVVAAMKDDADLICMAVSCGADVDTSEAIALRNAVYRRKPSTIKVLLEEGATSLSAALNTAINHSFKEIVELLLEFGADPDLVTEYSSVKSTPLANAAANGSVEIVRMLLDAGAKVESGEGHALAVAAKDGHEEVVQLLLSRCTSECLEMAIETARCIDYVYFNEAIARLKELREQRCGATKQCTSAK